jgi:hypothetical protein
MVLVFAKLNFYNFDKISKNTNIYNINQIYVVNLTIKYVLLRYLFGIANNQR